MDLIEATWLLTEGAELSPQASPLPNPACFCSDNCGHRVGLDRMGQSLVGLD